MIQINLLSQEQQKLNAAVAVFELKMYRRPLAERDPSRKKFNCPVCEERHEVSRKCVQQFAINKISGEVMIASKTKKGTLGAKQFAGTRIIPHRSHRKIEVHNRINELFQDAIRRAGEDVRAQGVHAKLLLWDASLRLEGEHARGSGTLREAGIGPQGLPRHRPDAAPKQGAPVAR